MHFNTHLDYAGTESMGIEVDQEHACSHTISVHTADKYNTELRLVTSSSMSSTVSLLRKPQLGNVSSSGSEDRAERCDSSRPGDVLADSASSWRGQQDHMSRGARLHMFYSRLFGLDHIDKAIIDGGGLGNLPAQGKP